MLSEGGGWVRGWLDFCLKIFQSIYNQPLIQLWVIKYSEPPPNSGVRGGIIFVQIEEPIEVGMRVSERPIVGVVGVCRRLAQAAAVLQNSECYFVAEQQE